MRRLSADDSERGAVARAETTGIDLAEGPRRHGEPDLRPQRVLRDERPERPGLVRGDGESAPPAFTTRLARVTPTLPDWSEATSVIEDAPGGLTDVVLTPGGLYLQNGQSVTFALGAPPEPFMLVRYTGVL